jgi:PAS domain S-box-containing protein
MVSGGVLILRTALIRMLGLGAGYYISGRLGLLLAVPPGYAAVVWPASGIALAGILLFGYEAWPGVLLGSFLVNIGVSFDGATLATTVRSMATAGWIGAGAALEACVGAAVIRRYVGFPTSLDEAGDIAKFLLLGGPLACLVNATWSVAALSFVGAIPWPAIPFNWFTWWVGDTIGVMVAAPLMLICAAEPRRVWRARWLPVGLPLVLAFTGAAAMFTKVSAWERTAVRLDFIARAEQSAGTLQTSLDNQVEDLYSVGSLYAGSSRVTRQAFHDFVARALSRHPGIKALEWVPRVTASQRWAYESAARVDGYPGFEIVDHTPGGRNVRAGLSDEYFPVYFVEPYRGNEAALGFDLASNPARHAALVEARDTGTLTATSAITLVQETGTSVGTLVFLPIYERGESISTADLRRQHLQGFALLVLRINDLMRSTLAHQPVTGVEQQLYDATSPGQRSVLWSSEGFRAARMGTTARDLAWRTTFAFGGRRWGILAYPGVEFASAHRSWESRVLFVMALLLTGLLGAVLLVMTGRTLKTEALAAENAALYKRYRSLFEAVPVGVYRTALDGQIVEVNPAFVRMLGYPDTNALKAVNAGVFYVDPDRWSQYRTLLERDGAVAGFEIQFRRCDGSYLWVEASARTTRDLDERTTYIEGAIVDTTERKQSEAHLAALNDILAAAAGASDLQAFLETLLDRTLAAVGASQGSVWFGNTAHAGRHDSQQFETEVVAAAIEAKLQPTRVEAVEDWRHPGEGTTAPLAPVMLRHGIRASLVAPLLVANRPVGGVSVEALHPRAWSAQDKAFVEAIGRQVGVVAERLRLLDEVRTRARDMEILHRSAQHMAETLDLQRVADDAVRFCVETCGLGMAWIARLDGSRLSQCLACYPADTRLPMSVIEAWSTLEDAADIAARFAAREPAVVQDFDAGTAPSLPWRAEQRALGLRSAAKIPLFSYSGPFGALILYGKEPGLFTAGRMEFFQAFAQQLATALENARLYDEANRRASELQALREIDQAISGSLELGVSLNLVLSKALAVLKVDAACVLLFEPAAQLLEHAADQGFRTTVLRGIQIRLGEGLAGRAAHQRRRLAIADLDAEPNSLVMLRRPQGGREGFKTTYAVPLIAKGQLMGVLQVFFRRPMTPTAEWLGFFDTLAGQTAIAISDARQFQALQRLKDDLVLAYDATLEGWARALELRDKGTEGHVQRTTAMTLRLAGLLGVPADELVHIRRGALLHDIGKIAIPDAVLQKPRPLSAQERAIVERHPTYARDLLTQVPFLHRALDIPYCHHEKWDGTGYPRGLKGEDIPFAARIFAIVDVWDALTSNRPYRPAWSCRRARQYLRAQSGHHFDPRVVEAFLAMEFEAGAARNATARSITEAGA